MKKFISVLIASILISYTVFAQSAGDFRSIGSGNWNDPTKWESYNGSSWDSTTAYPGQKSGNGKVTIMTGMEIKITETIPHPVTALSVSIDDPNILPTGLLTFSAETAVSLIVSGDVIIGELRIDDQNGAKTHELFIGGNFSVYRGFQAINQDDKLSFTFNTTDPNSTIQANVTFQDITFNGTGILVNTNMFIAGTATFINGIVSLGMPDVYFDYPDYAIMFLDGATVSGGSNVSYILGRVAKFGDDPFTFPIGDNGFYAPITISGLQGESEIHATYSRSGSAAGSSITDPEIFSVSGCEWWNLSYSLSSADYDPFDVTVGWTSDTRCGSSSYISNVVEVVLTTGYSHGGTGTGTTTNGSVTWSGFNGGYITLGNVGIDCRIPFGLNSTNITSSSATINWSAVTGAVSYDVDYYSNNSSSWINAATGITSTSVNLSSLSPSVTYFSRVRANCGSASSSYRQVHFTTLQTPLPPPPLVCNDVNETNNTSSEAKAISLGNTISAGISSTADVDWFKLTTPNNSNTNLKVTLSNSPADYDLYVYNKHVYTKRLKLIGSSLNSGTLNEVVIYNSNARKATYYIKVVAKNGVFNTSQCYTLLAQGFSNGGRTASNTSAPVNEVTEDLNKQFLYPNPASEFVYLNFNSATEGLVNIQIVNSIGQLVKQHPVNTIKGYNQFKIQVADIRPGMYILRINKGDLNLTRKFVIAR